MKLIETVKTRADYILEEAKIETLAKQHIRLTNRLKDAEKDAERKREDLQKFEKTPEEYLSFCTPTEDTNGKIQYI